VRLSIILAAAVLLMTLTAAADPWLGNVQTVAADPNNQYDPVTVYNSVHNEYLVLWTTGWPDVNKVVGIRVDSLGLPIGSSFPISEPGNDQWEPAAAYDPVNDRYFVIWSFDYSGDGTDTDILGRFIPWDGPTPGEPVFVVNEALSLQMGSALAYNPETLEYLAVWQDNEETGPYSILGRRLSADGSSASTTFNVINGPLDAFEPKVAWNGETSEFLVVYEQPNAGGGSDVYGTRLAADGIPILPSIGIAGWPGGEWDPNVAACRDGFLVVWVASLGADRDDDTEVYARAVTGDGAVGTIVTDLPGAFTSERDPFVACNEGGGEVLVSWQAMFTDSLNSGIVGAFLELDADPQGGVFSIYAPSVGNDLDFQSPGLAFGAEDHALVAWDSDRLPDGSLIDVHGRFVGNRLFADGFESGDIIYWTDLDP